MCSSGVKPITPAVARLNRNNQYMRKNRYTQDQVIAALKATKGMTYLAAKQLQCDPDTIMNYCKKCPAVEAAKHDARGEMLDVAELKLWAAVQRDEAWAITFCLRTVGRSRGYGEALHLHVQIEAAAAKVGQELGLSAESLLAEATLLLQEMDRDELSRPALD
jgi:hypothetical protein